MKILITGNETIIGQAICREWQHVSGAICRSCSTLNCLDREEAIRAVTGSNADVVIHCAGTDDNKWCEENQHKAFEINSVTAANVAMACSLSGKKMIIISSCMMFEGQSTNAWREDESLVFTKVYGKSRLAAEKAVTTILGERSVILRYGMLFGFSGDLIDKFRAGQRNCFPFNIICNPISLYELLKILRYLINSPDLNGIFHAAGEESCSRSEILAELLKYFKVSGDFVTPASAFAGWDNCSMQNTRLLESGYPPIPGWRISLNEYLKGELNI